MNDTPITNRCWNMNGAENAPAAWFCAQKLERDNIRLRAAVKLAAERFRAPSVDWIDAAEECEAALDKPAAP